MLYNQIINQISEYVENACQQPSNCFGKALWDNHILEVVKYAEVLALQSGAQRDVVVLAALLHDIAGILDESLYAEHHIHSMGLAEEILKRYDYPSERIAMVTACIYTHRGSRKLPPKSIEARCVANADAMAHISRVDSLLVYAHNERGLNDQQSQQFVYDKINRSWKKMHGSIRKLFEAHYQRALLQLKVAA